MCPAKEQNSGQKKRERTETTPGLILVQIDGLSYRYYLQALEKNRLPFLKTLLTSYGYQGIPMYSGLPSTTPAVQAELFYGIKGAVPAFCYLDSETNELGKMFDPYFATKIQSRLESSGENLLKGGHAYSNIYSGGAESSLFCAGSFDWNDTLPRLNWLYSLWLGLRHPFSILRIVTLLFIELFLAITDFFRGILGRRNFLKELRFVPMRVMICVLLRELATIFAVRDARKGVPIIHLNYLGYDEQAHRRGPSSRFAQWSLKGIDSSMARIWRAARKSKNRAYSLWVYSDHGQEEVASYALIHNMSVEEKILRILGQEVDASAREIHRGIQNRRAGWIRNRKKQKAGQTLATKIENAKIQIAAIGSVGHIYGLSQCNTAELLEIAEQLVHKGSIPLVTVPYNLRQVYAVNKDGTFLLPDQADSIVGEHHPFRKTIPADLIRLCTHPDSGTLQFFGWCKGERSISYPVESGAHAGFGPAETEAFLQVPRTVATSLQSAADPVRPLDLRDKVFEYLGRDSSKQGKQPQELRIATYNIRSCMGLDGSISPERTAEIIASMEVDIIAIQEIDAGSARSGNIDQLTVMANQLNMRPIFLPTITRDPFLYGIGILSKFDFQVMKCDLLPRFNDKKQRERRAAIWIKIDIDGRPVHIFNTHLSLSPRERRIQMNELLSERWLGKVPASESVIICGDLNCIPRSYSYSLLAAKFVDVQQKKSGRRPQATWPTHYPFRRIDHIFISPDLEVVQSEVLMERRIRKASDHAPLIANIHF